MPTHLLTDPQIRAAVKTAGKAVQAGQKVQELNLYDAKAPGLALRIRAGGVASWSFLFRELGEDLKRRHTIGRYPSIPLSDAREIADGYRARMKAEPGWSPRREVVAAEQAREQAAVNAEADANRLNVAGLCALWLARYAKRHRKIWPEDERSIRVDINPLLGAIPIDTLKRAKVAEAMETLAERAPVHTNRVLSRLKGIFAWGVKVGLIENNVVAGLDKPSPETSRDRTLDDAEIARVWTGIETARITEGTQIIMKLVLVTGARVGEVTAMERRELHLNDLGGPVWLVPASKMKGGREHAVPLSALAMMLINQALAIADARRAEGATAHQPVFLSPDGAAPATRYGISAGMRRIQDHLGLEKPVSNHDLRRTCASGMARLGISREVISHVLAHSSGLGGSAITAVYDRFDRLPEKRAALYRWAAHLERLTSGTGQADNVVVALARVPA